MLDAHCHLNYYSDPSTEAQRCEKKKIVTIAVTNLPSEFEKVLPFLRIYKYIRFALGFHPLEAVNHRNEKEKFLKLLDKTSYVGEIGLDFSAEGVATKDLQIESFRFVLKAISSKRCFITIHSRKAESEVLKILVEEKVSPVVFHWYSGSITNISKAVKLGHFFSINPSMISSNNGKRIIAEIPKERVITETDGPFLRVGSRSAVPSDVEIVEEYLAKIWKMSKVEVAKIILTNFQSLTNPLRIQKT